MAMSLQSLFDLTKFVAHPLAHRSPFQEKLSAPRLRTDVCEAEEVEALRFSQTTFLLLLGCVAAKPHKARLVRMQLQGELSESVSEFA